MYISTVGLYAKGRYITPCDEYRSGDVIAVRLDLNANTVVFRVNGTNGTERGEKRTVPPIWCLSRCKEIVAS